MQVIVEPGTVNGTVIAPPSKSITQRTLAAALLHNGCTTIHNAGYSADEEAALKVITDLGAEIQQNRTSEKTRTIVVRSQGLRPRISEVNCGESGLAARLFLPIISLHAGTITVAATGTLLKRPVVAVIEALLRLGVGINCNGEYLPCSVSGPLVPASHTIDAGGSSQLISGLLFAYAFSATKTTTLKVTGLESKPYIDLTLDTLKTFGRPVTNNSYNEFVIDPSIFTHHEEVTIDVEADWSSAACLLVAGALAGSITVTNLSPASLQADRMLLRALEDSGATISWEGNRLTVSREGILNPFDFDATDCPDLFPALAALASSCFGESSITGLHRLFHKESNRVESITEMLWRFGVPFSAGDNTLCITGLRRVRYTSLDSYNDHRIAMAAAVCALRAKGPVSITHAEAVSKSYPGFFNDLASTGAMCTIAT